jgi:Phasin protein.
MTIKAKEARRPFVGWPDANGWAGGWAPVLEANRVALDRWTKVSDTMVKGMFAISQEMTQFAQTRLKEEAKNCEALSHCHNPSEALSCQHRFAEAATAEYLEEADKMTVLMTKIANDGFASLLPPRA